MKRFLGLGLLASLVSFGTPETLTAQVQLSTPKFQITLGGPIGFAIDSPVVNFRAGKPLIGPGGAIPLGEPSQPLGQPGGPVLPPPRQLPPPTVQPVPPPVVIPVPAPRPVPVPRRVIPNRPMTHKEFLSYFEPIPGRHEVTLIHSRRGCPVRVCFDLPPGCPKVICRRHGFEFDYGKCEVEVRFALFGRVKVDYDD